MTSAIWPKAIPSLTPEQQRISDDFMRYWHEVLPRRYGLVEEFNQRYAVQQGNLHVCSRGAGGRAMDHRGAEEAAWQPLATTRLSISAE